MCKQDTLKHLCWVVVVQHFTETADVGFSFNLSPVCMLPLIGTETYTVWVTIDQSVHSSIHLLCNLGKMASERGYRGNN